jgi:hypothetical protein
VNKIEVIVIAELHTNGKHVTIHVLNPGDKLVEIVRLRRLAHAMNNEILTDPLVQPAGIGITRQNMHLNTKLCQSSANHVNVAR